MKKCKENKHNFTPWETEYDPKEGGEISFRYCLNCPTKQRVKGVPIEEQKIPIQQTIPTPNNSDSSDVINWLETQMKNKNWRL